MKNFKVFLLSLIGFFLAISPGATMAAQALGASPLLVGSIVTAGTVLAYNKFSSNVNAFVSGVENETWVDYMIQRFWKDNAFLKFFFNESKRVLAGRVVHIPQPGTKPTATKNRTEFPAVAVRRTQTDITYLLDEYSVDPSHIHNLDKIELTFDAMDEAYGDQLGVLNEVIADDTIIKILTGIPAGSIIKTSGDAVLATLENATGNRKAAVHKDIRRIKLLMNTKNVKKTDRYALLEENMADQIFESLSDNQERDFSRYADAETGVLGVLYGFKIMTRSSVAAATNADVIRALGATTIATDCAVSLFWQKDCVAFALGDIDMFDDLGNPLYYGDIISSTQRMGCRRRRADNLGVVAYIQATAA